MVKMKSNTTYEQSSYDNLTLEVSNTYVEAICYNLILMIKVILYV